MAKEYYDEKKEKQRQSLYDKLEFMPEYVQRFFRSKAQSLAPSTCNEYASDLLNFFNWLTQANPALKNLSTRNVPIEALDALTSDDIDEYLFALTNENKTKARKLASLRVFFNYLIKVKLVSSNPAAMADNPKLEEKNIITLSTDDKRAFLAAVENGKNLTKKGLEIHEVTKYRDIAIIYLLLGTGIRVSELVGLNMKDVNLETGRINLIRKGGNADYVYANDEVLEALTDYIEFSRDSFKATEKDEDALFLSRKHTRLTTRSVEYMVKKYADASLGVGNHITPHKMRSTYASNALDMTSGDLFSVAKNLGHKGVGTAARHYLSVTDEQKLKVSRVSIKE